MPAGGDTRAVPGLPGFGLSRLCLFSGQGYAGVIARLWPLLSVFKGHRNYRLASRAKLGPHPPRPARPYRRLRRLLSGYASAGTASGGAQYPMPTLVRPPGHLTLSWKPAHWEARFVRREDPPRLANARAAKASNIEGTRVYARFEKMGRRRVRRLAMATTAGVLGIGSLVVAMEASAAEGSQLQIRTAAGTSSTFIVTATQQTGTENSCFEIDERVVALGQSAVLQPFGNKVVEVGTPVTVLSFASTDCTHSLIGDCRTTMPAASGAALFPELDAFRCTWSGV